MTTRVVAIAGKKNAQNVSAGTATLRELQFFLSKTKKYTAAVYCAVIIRQCTSRSRVASTVYLTYMYNKKLVAGGSEFRVTGEEPGLLHCDVWGGHVRD